MRAARVDANHRAIVAALRACGWSVESLAAVGRGVPDLLIGRAGQTELVEVKIARGKTSPVQRDWHARWRGKPVRILRTVEEVETL